jgi:ABC-2 type transport system ATP-binding protein
MIEIRDLSKSYGKRQVLACMSLTMTPGEIVLLLGANGAGKSTLLRCLLGTTSFAGSIRVNGKDPLTDGPSVRASIGYMPQSGGLHLDLTVGETVDFYAGIRGASRDRGLALLSEAGLDACIDIKVGELSGGMRQRLGFALALLTDPQILVLDEPSASLDAASRRWLAARLRSTADEGRRCLHARRAGIARRGRSLGHAGRRTRVVGRYAPRSTHRYHVAAHGDGRENRPPPSYRSKRAARRVYKPLAARVRGGARRTRSGRDGHRPR